MWKVKGCDYWYQTVLTELVENIHSKYEESGLEREMYFVDWGNETGCWVTRSETIALMKEHYQDCILTPIEVLQAMCIAR